ncbi:AVAST type 4 anti-phage nuclease Avs4 [Ignatzschineria cameli]|uniref:AVAST type 4 anti-phage nuclease Avs4 n=1 Tax=Ignatzschineria cameli TaxID=2182793 RepID=UPI000D612EA3|nr:AVAST type 4 anti-phage nuclease Avs4 [Ignatzschineria cameli]PWD87630.1 hypothetical protein DC080_01100 [Ignatzschineria cameli]
MNWHAFSVKNNEKESWAFERLSYLLFCAEFDNRIGLFRYKNQTGIETEPLKKDNQYYGFQAKYYKTPISKNTHDIIDSIRKAKNTNPHLQNIYLYLNQELSESNDKKKKKPKYQLDVEESAKRLGVTIHWRVPSHFELQLSLPENQYLVDIFFNLEPNDSDFIFEINKHNDQILRAIQTEIPYGKEKIKIDRTTILEELKADFQNQKNIIISGEGGSGKTAILKEFYNLHCKNMPICVFKANELNVSHINEIFHFDNKFTFTQFLNIFKDEAIKVFVIDSAEKLAEIPNNYVLIALIQQLKENGWSIFFTTRYSYLNDLVFHVKENYQLFCEVRDVPLMPTEYLHGLSNKFQFTLPENLNFIERLRNLFYLSEYIQQNAHIDKNGNFKEFVNLLWKKRIQNNSVQTNNLHLEREKCMVSIARQRCDTGLFFINPDNLSQTALFNLRQDEIITYDEAHDGYFITHDIYEEWALEKIISRYYSNYLEVKQFFDELGSSLSMRRAFRLWLAECLLEESNQEIKNFIQEAFIHSEITQFWKDEILISILLSDYSAEFFKLFTQEILTDDAKILKRILFLLRIACTDISISSNFERIRPKGKGWEETVFFIYKNKSEFFYKNFKLVLPILSTWCESNDKGNTTRYSGLLATSLIEKSENEERFYIHNEEEDILKIIFNASSQIKEELKKIFDVVLANKWTKHRNPYVGLCTKILDKPYLATKLIVSLPLSVIQLCDLFWQAQPVEDDDSIFGSYRRDSMEDRYGLSDDHHFSYFPSSANQTPIKWLLQIAFHKTLDFIVDFTNRSVETYSESDYGKEDVIQVSLNIEGKEVTQYLSWSIWSMYRGNGSPVVPGILQSIHMALEAILLNISKQIDSESELTGFKNILLKILTQSKSASLTAVVTSIVLADPDKYYSIALILFNTIEFFQFDSIRSLREHNAKSLYSIGYGMNLISDRLYANERLSTCKDEHRKINLETLFFNYQFYGVKGFTEEQNDEFINKLYQIIDKHKSCPEKSKNFGILLARMDSRNLIPKATKQVDDKLLIEFETKELSDDLKQKSEQATNQFQDLHKYGSLRIWSDFLSNINKEGQQYEKYNDNPLIALSETKQLINELELGREGLSDYVIPAFVCSKLLIEYRNTLANEDKEFCKEIVLSFISNSFHDDYHYQISDGTEASIHAIPALITEFPEEMEKFILYILFILLDDTPIGSYKRVCDYAIESIRKSNLWINNESIAQTILFGYIQLVPIYKKLLNKKYEQQKKQRNWGAISKRTIIKDLEDNQLDSIFENNSFEIEKLTLLDIYDLEIVLQLIPSNTQDKVHLNICKSIYQNLANQLLDESKISEKQKDTGSLYLLRLKIFKRFAHFILQREKKEIDNYLQPFIDSFISSEEAGDLIKELVMTEDILNHNEQFWCIWDCLYPSIKKLCIEHPNRHYLKKIIINYLLAWKWWQEGQSEWHSLKKENIYIYNDASQEIGHVPATLYSIVRVLNTIGSHFIDDGINWIYNIVSRNPSLNLDDLESNSLFYLEKLMRRFIFENKQRIKQETRLKTKIISILDFMIERGSAHAYHQREAIM